MPTDVLRGIFAAPVMRWTQTNHKHFTRSLATIQNMVNVAIRSGVVKQPANNAA
jgi:hypothetical protein